MAPLKAPRANPLAFTPCPVTIITTVVYLALIIPLLVVHLVVPSAPSTSPSGLNITEAWADLETLTDGFRPYNSRQNDNTRTWLLKRISKTLNAAPSVAEFRAAGEEKPEVLTFDDTQSNLTFLGNSGVGVYFEGTNIIVYIRGSEDDTERWWEDPNGTPIGRGGVLVNSHYDSVSTGHGATDDGIAVISCLQLIKYFTTPGHAPRRGLVVLFNNGEEDFLNGARAYSQHPISKFPHTFLNLEGTGAGGRATLFRTSDTEVTRPYAKSAHPFGTVVSADGFRMGLVRSQTDYVVFEGILGLRGLDVAFIEPRARYHTDQDDARHTNKDSLWHMLSAAVTTTEGLVSDNSFDFDGPRREDGKVASGSGSSGVWFDLFGSTFAVFQLHTLFALSVTLLIVTPLVLLFTGIALTRADKMYLFRTTAKSEDNPDGVSLRGLRGLFRFPFLFGIPSAVAVGLAYLLTKINPYIIHSSEWAVWSMMIASWLFLAWFVARVADFARPSALHRVYTLTWMFVLMWVLLVVATVFGNKLGLAGGYFIFFYFCGVSVATWLSYLELFALPRKSEYASLLNPNQPNPSSGPPSSAGNRYGSVSGPDDGDDADAEEEPTESSSLLRRGRGRGHRTTFANYVGMSGSRAGQDNEENDDEEDAAVDPKVYKHEQAWSSSLPKWTWILQFLLIAPLVLTIIGPIGLLQTTALHQTGQDGSSSLFIYLAIAALTTLLFSPLLPFMHRYTYHIPMFLLLVFTGTLIYNLVAFPFSETSRLKVAFIQEVDLDTGVNRVSLTGVPPFVQDAIHALPSAAGQDITCVPHRDRQKCSWSGLAPHVVENNNKNNTNNNPSPDWVSFNITKQQSNTSTTSIINSNNNNNQRKAQFTIKGQNTRACKLTFNSPITNFTVHGSSPPDPRFQTMNNKSNSTETKQILLWSRTWESPWTVDVEWPAASASASSTVTGKVVCLWSDYNQSGLIPALDEVMAYVPVWVAVTKLDDGLVEGGRGFEVSF